MLVQKLNNLGLVEIRKIYSKFWNGGECYTLQDLREHVRRYIIMFFQLRHYKNSCRNKAKILINAIKTI